MWRDFACGPVAKNPPSNAGSIPRQGTEILLVSQQLSSSTPTTEPSHLNLRSLRATTKSPCKDPAQQKQKQKKDYGSKNQDVPSYKHSCHDSLQPAPGRSPMTPRSLWLGGPIFSPKRVARVICYPSLSGVNQPCLWNACGLGARNLDRYSEMVHVCSIV